MAQAPVPVREASWDEVNPRDENFVWVLNRAASQVGNVTTLSGSFKVWINVQRGKGAFETWVYYDKFDAATGNIVETVKCRYEPHFSDFAPGHAARETLAAVFAALADTYPWLKWLILIFSIFETGTGVRGRSRRVVNNQISQKVMPMLLRGLFPPIVAFVSTSFAEASILLLVSSLPFFRGNVKARWWMNHNQAVAETTTQFLLSVLIVYCVALICSALLPKYQSQVGQGDGNATAFIFGEETAMNPFAFLFSRSVEMKFRLNVGTGAGVILASFIVYNGVSTILQISFGTLNMHYGRLSSDHSHSFISWRFQKQLCLARGMAEPALGKVEVVLQLFMYFVTFILLFFVELDIPTFVLTILAYEMDLGYALGNDVSIMTLFNVAASNFQDSLQESTISEVDLLPALEAEIEHIEATYVFRMSRINQFEPFGIGRGYRITSTDEVNNFILAHRQ